MRLAGKSCCKQQGGGNVVVVQIYRTQWLRMFLKEEQHVKHRKRGQQQEIGNKRMNGQPPISFGAKSSSELKGPQQWLI
jgi:hypothetical protein